MQLTVANVMQVIDSGYGETSKLNAHTGVNSSAM